MALDVFASISDQFDPALTSGVTSIMSNTIAANASILTSALTLYVIVWGALTAFGQVSMASMMQAAGRAAAVSLLMTAAFFTPYVQTPFLTTIPNWIATVTTGTPESTAATQFSQLWSAAQHMEAQIYEQASGLFYIASRLEAGMITIGIGILLSIAFLVFEIARWMMDVLVCALPFVLWLYLFKSTRGVPERLLGKMVGLLILDVLIDVILQVTIAADMKFMEAAQTGASAGVTQMIASLADCLVFFMFGTAMLIMCPMIAAYIGGGVGIPTAQMARLARTTSTATRTVARVITRR